MLRRARPASMDAMLACRFLALLAGIAMPLEVGTNRLRKIAPEKLVFLLRREGGPRFRFLLRNELHGPHHCLAHRIPSRLFSYNEYGADPVKSKLKISCEPFMAEPASISSFSG